MVAVTASGPRALDVTFLSGGCIRDTEVSVEEGPQEVVVSASGILVSGDCDNIGIEETVKVNLDQDLGKRSLRPVTDVGADSGG